MLSAFGVDHGEVSKAFLPTTGGAQHVNAKIGGKLKRKPTDALSAGRSRAGALTTRAAYRERGGKGNIAGFPRRPLP